ncbi:MAG: 2,3-bisphosphoglycerate-independent phosphoglycerate mutase [Candidatus Omnitrophota bacterium]|nr:MAG: 2,3-bisphosphoglycerate-independent phosphoglycerate mutase [Candidatus Omnitrophota bacterium]
MKKIVYIVLDGLGDLPHPDLGNKTPLEAAESPYLDKLSRAGQNGLMYTVGKDIAPESDIAVISILGYDAERYYTGRGPLESYAEGVEVKDGDLAYRVNFATLGEGKNIIDRRVGRNLTTEEATELSKEVNAKVKLTSLRADVKFKNTIGHRGIVVIHPLEGRLSAEVTNTDPAYDKKGHFGVAKEVFEKVLQTCRPVQGKENSPEAVNAAKLTNEFVEKSHLVLEESPINKKRESQGKLKANLILTRDAGDRLPKLPQMKERFGASFGCFVEMPVERGIALLTGMQIIELPLPSGDPQKDYPLRAEKVLSALEKFDGLYIHIKGPDEPAHDGKAREKKDSIEAIDKYFFANLIPHLDMSNSLVCVTADHSTPCTLKAHSADPVPVLISGAEIRPDEVKTFSENTCREGSLKVLQGPELLPLLLKLAKKK